MSEPKNDPFKEFALKELKENLLKWLSDMEDSPRKEELLRKLIERM